MHYSSGGRSYSAAFYVIWFAVGIAFACIPAFIASHKGRSFGLWFLFGLFCFLPALIVSLVISDRAAVGPPFGSPGYGAWNPQPGGWVPPGPGPGSPSWSPPPPPTVPAGWYPDPGGTAAQRYWDGTRWTEHLH